MSGDELVGARRLVAAAARAVHRQAAWDHDALLALGDLVAALLRIAPPGVAATALRETAGRLELRPTLLENPRSAEVLQLLGALLDELERENEARPPHRSSARLEERRSPGDEEGPRSAAAS